MDKRPIGIFDSGIGGLTVCNAIKYEMPTEHIIYFGDTARFPYGTRSKETLIRYSKEITEYLLSRDVKMIVIACNTASSVALERLKQDYDIPIIGVIEAGAVAACNRLKDRKIGVIGTRATIKSESYVKAIRKINPDVNIVQKHTTIFVSLTEEGWIDDEITRLTAKKYIQSIYDSGVRTLILGCTHFPLLKKAINDVYPDMYLIDTGIEIAHEVKSILEEKNLENKEGIGDIELYASDITDTLQELIEKFIGDGSTAISKLVIDGNKL